MKALVFDNELKLDLNYPKPIPRDNEVLIKTSLVGICNTDYEITKGYMGFKGVLGHEFVGVVVDKGKNVPDEIINKRVVGEINCNCNDCEYCFKDLGRHCPNRSTLGIFNKDGCFSEYFTLPYKNILVVPNEVNDKTAVLIEPLAAAYEILEQIHIKPKDKVAVVGDGKLGLSIAMIFSALNIDFIHIGKHPNKLKITQNLKAKTLLLDELDEKYNAYFDVVVEATGSIGGFKTSEKLTKPRGTLVLKSTIAADEGLNLSGIVVNEITIVGSRCGQFEPVMRLFKKGLIDTTSLITKIYPLDNFKEAFEHNTKKDALKILVQF